MTTKPATAASTQSRIEALDYLRGFFILIIIVDHIYRWPNLFEFISGRGELWSSAAEGFVIISGLLIGYVRGRKNINQPLSTVSRKVVLRGLMLYVWTVITTIVLVAISWFFTFKSPVAYVPYAPYDWAGILHDVLTLHFAHSLTHFLYLYAIFLFLAPILLLLLRKKLWWLALIGSGALWIYGYRANEEWMQWQAVFYIPAVAGFFLDDSIRLFQRIPKYTLWAFVGAGLATMLWSLIIALPQPVGTYHPLLFSREPLTFERILLSFFWFTTVALLFHKFLPFIKRSFGWLLHPLGTKSLTAYISHIIPISAFTLLVAPTSSFVNNTLITIVAIMVTWGIVKIPGINTVIPR